MTGSLILVDGCCCVVINWDVVAKGSQFFVKDVEVVVAQVDLDTISFYFTLSIFCYAYVLNLDSFLYYLRRSGAYGFLLPLSGGADSSSVATIVGCMCQLVVEGQLSVP
ncbi:hypothetical protein IFM89_034352 [Coptis chinensis]|uniref:Glutamine-dependent NAD(+) synthetase n=1 Tax=Coptis chinensis TaxID=261450 RepID=A0A835LK86_9MAGN|nr:hypothetical protein IFM89_034352 [Coptis chinensis]